jgi:hypothetical protein
MAISPEAHDRWPPLGVRGPSVSPFPLPHPHSRSDEAGGILVDTRFDRCSVSAAREVASSRYTFCSAVVKLKARATPSCIFDFVLCAGGEGVRICRARRRGFHRPKGHRAKCGSRHVTSVTPGVCKTRPSVVHGRARQELIGSGDPPRPLCSLQTAPLILCL